LRQNHISYKTKTAIASLRVDTSKIYLLLWQRLNSKSNV